MITMSLEAVASAMGADCQGVAGRESIRRVTTDSRDVQPGDLFFAIVGERFDGHDFIREVGANGAVACVCDRDWWETKAERGGSIDSPLLVVDDTVVALGLLGTFYRREVMSSTTAVIAITGSNGKTTTKAMLDHVLHGSLPGRAAPMSFNNELGVPLTLLSSEPGDRYLIVEIGTNAPGEVARLADMVSPDIGVITSIGEAHLEGFGDIDAIAKEKASLLEYVRPNGVGVVNADRCEIKDALNNVSAMELLTFGIEAGADLRITRSSTDLTTTRCLLDGRFEVELHLPGLHHTTNAAAVVAVSRRLGISPEESIVRLRTFSATGGRACVHEFGALTVVDDTYNANPVSMLAAVDTLGSVANRRRVFVMGDMFELGEMSEAMHERMVRRAALSGIDCLVAVGANMRRACQAVSGHEEGMQLIVCKDASHCSAKLVTLLRGGDAVWLKGSRAMRLDKVVVDLKTRVNQYARGTSLATAGV
jgi:UDP-N-acetylmuramoyl-tripeptide--D-alanyl-D-alanine ligase